MSISFIALIWIFKSQTSPNIKLKFFLFLCLLSFSLHSQLLPPIQSYLPKDYNGANQNWMITQSKDKEIFFANNSGLLTFNGSRWNMFFSANGSIVRSAKYIGNRVYTGAYQDFGYWEKTNKGVYAYISLAEKSKLIIDNDEEFWDVLDFDDWVIFQSLTRLIMFNKVSEKIEFFDPGEDISNSFIVDSRLYFTLKSGLYTFENRDKLLLSDDPRLINYKNSHHIVSMFSNNGNLLLLTDELKFFELYPNGTLIPSNISPNPLNEGTTVYSAIRLIDNIYSNFAVYSSKKGGKAGEHTLTNWLESQGVVKQGIEFRTDEELINQGYISYCAAEGDNKATWARAIFHGQRLGIPVWIFGYSSTRTDDLLKYRDDYITEFVDYKNIMVDWASNIMKSVPSDGIDEDAFCVKFAGFLNQHKLPNAANKGRPTEIGLVNAQGKSIKFDYLGECLTLS